MRSIPLDAVLDSIKCNYTLIGKDDVTIERALPIEVADGRSITFCNKRGEQGRKLISESRAALLITAREHEDACRATGATCILVDDPRLAFARVVEAMFSKEWPEGIHPTAVVAASAKIGKDVFIGPFCSVGERSEIGDGSRLEAGVTIYDSVRVGENVIIRAGAVLGTDGFGFNRNENGELEKFPQIGSVVVDDDVEIGSNTCIARGTMTETRIGRGTKIDNLVHISHNVEIGKDCIVTAMVWIGGSAKVGDRCWLSPSVTILNGVKVGNDVTVAMRSSVINDIASGEFVAGNPARPTIRKK